MSSLQPRWYTYEDDDWSRNQDRKQYNNQSTHNANFSANNQCFDHIIEVEVRLGNMEEFYGHSFTTVRGGLTRIVVGASHHGAIISGVMGFYMPTKVDTLLSEPVMYC